MTEVYCNSSRVDFDVAGDRNGRPILFVPGSFSAPAAWRSIQARLPSRYCFIGTSILGYGRTAETRSADNFDMDLEVQALGAVADAIGRPFHVVGHSFGATVALAAELADRIEPLSITTFEANPCVFLDDHQPELSAQFHQVGKWIREQHARGDDSAAAVVIDYWGGGGSFAGLPEPVKDYCRATTASNVLDWQTVGTFGPTDDDWRKIDEPSMLVRGANANEAMQAITTGLASLIPNSQTRTVDGASHFLISTHADECAKIIVSQLERFD